MIHEAYRITKTKYLDGAFDGEGAWRFGGRWNSAGVRMVYVASSLSLATLELLVHTEDITLIQDFYSVVPIQFNSAMVETCRLEDLPVGWDSPEPISATQTLGDRWIKSGVSAILEVPSAVTAQENNYLLNPDHEAFSGIALLEAYPFRIDSRLV